MTRAKTNTAGTVAGQIRAAGGGASLLSTSLSPSSKLLQTHKDNDRDIDTKTLTQTHKGKDTNTQRQRHKHTKTKT